MTSLQFGRELQLASTGVVLTPKGELRVINTNSHNKKEKGLVPVPAPRGDNVGHPDIIESQQWIIVTNRKSRGKTKASSCNVVSVSSREIEKGIASHRFRRRGICSRC